MNTILKSRLLEICEQVSQDVESDAKDLDGQPFTGKVVATQFGNHAAAIKALSTVLTEVLNEINKYSL